MSSDNTKEAPRLADKIATNLAKSRADDLILTTVEAHEVLNALRACEAARSFPSYPANCECASHNDENDMTIECIGYRDGVEAIQALLGDPNTVPKYEKDKRCGVLIPECGGPCGNTREHRWHTDARELWSHAFVAAIETNINDLKDKLSVATNDPQNVINWDDHCMKCGHTTSYWVHDPSNRGATNFHNFVAPPEDTNGQDRCAHLYPYPLGYRCIMTRQQHLDYQPHDRAHQFVPPIIFECKHQLKGLSGKQQFPCRLRASHSIHFNREHPSYHVFDGCIREVDRSGA